MPRFRPLRTIVSEGGPTACDGGASSFGVSREKLPKCELWRLVLDQKDFQTERAKHRFQSVRPHLLVLAAGSAAILAEQFCRIAAGQASKPINL
jgi:hypothetical protein